MTETFAGSAPLSVRDYHDPNGVSTIADTAKTVFIGAITMAIDASASANGTNTKLSVGSGTVTPYLNNAAVTVDGTGITFNEAGTYKISLNDLLVSYETGNQNRLAFQDNAAVVDPPMHVLVINSTAGDMDANVTIENVVTASATDVYDLYVYRLSGVATDKLDAFSQGGILTITRLA